VEGKWCLQALFNAPGRHQCGNDTDIVAIRATSEVVIPIISTFGAVGTLATMSLILVLLHNKKKKQN
jgi:hypothetical protein